LVFRNVTDWIDTHCHLDAPEFRSDVQAVCARAAQAGVRHCVLPAVGRFDFETVRELAHAHGYSYALGIHPLFVSRAADEDLAHLDQWLSRAADDPRLVAVGEIGLDYFVPALCQEPLRSRQEHFYRAQLKLARRHGLPVLLHVRRSVDKVLAGLRSAGAGGHAWSGIAHAFSGSPQQADACLAMGLKLGFGGAVTFETALQLRRLATGLPLSALVMETDAPDIPPHWLYRTAAERAAGQAQGRNEPAELPRIAAEVARLRGVSSDALARATTAAARQALPKLAALLV
jgi:TatD DNase family protein